MEDHKLDPAVQTKNAFAIALLNDAPKPVNINVDDLFKHFRDDSKNEGLRKRRAAVAESKIILLMDRLHLDLCQQANLLPNDVNVRLRFNRSKPQFYMMTDAGSSGKVVIHSIVLWVREIKPTPTVLNAINPRLNTETVKYPLRRVEVKTLTIPTGAQSKIRDHLFQE